MGIRPVVVMEYKNLNQSLKDQRYQKLYKYDCKILCQGRQGQDLDIC